VHWQNKFKKKTGVLPPAEPSINQIGHLVKLSCGHNGRLSAVETHQLTQHIEMSDFIKEPASSEQL
jgi:hypothetical protein